MGGIRSTPENLDEAMHGEEFEFKQMYPKFIEEAKTEGHDTALISFKNAMAVEQVHYSLYTRAIEKIREGEDLAGHKIYVCGVCGNTVLDELPNKCPVCGVGKDRFTEIE